MPYLGQRGALTTDIEAERLRRLRQYVDGLAGAAGPSERIGWLHALEGLAAGWADSLGHEHGITSSDGRAEGSE